MDYDIETYLQSLGNRISKVREEKNLTQYRLAKEIFTDQSNLARIEEGKVNPTIKTLLKISSALGCKVRDIIDF